ncbi:unnamed protein product [Chrysoparadoxa australica]
MNHVPVLWRLLCRDITPDCSGRAVVLTGVVVQGEEGSIVIDDGSGIARVLLEGQLAGMKLGAGKQVCVTGDVTLVGSPPEAFVKACSVEEETDPNVHMQRWLESVYLYKTCYCSKAMQPSGATAYCPSPSALPPEAGAASRGKQQGSEGRVLELLGGARGGLSYGEILEGLRAACWGEQETVLEQVLAELQMDSQIYFSGGKYLTL